MDRAADETILPAVKALDVELLPLFDTIQPPEYRWQNNSTLGRDGDLHASNDVVLPQALSTARRLRRRVVQEVQLV